MWPRALTLLLFLSVWVLGADDTVRFWAGYGNPYVTRFAVERLGWKRVYWPHNAQLLLSWWPAEAQPGLDLRYVRGDQLISQIEEIDALSNRSNLTLALHASGLCPDRLCSFTYVLDDPEECELLRERLRDDLTSWSQRTEDALRRPDDSDTDYGAGLTPWILKRSQSGSGRGLTIFWNSRALLEAITSCQHVEEAMVAQPYVMDGALIQGRKVCFQTHVLVASTHPLLVLYRDGAVWLAKEGFTGSRHQRAQEHFAGATSSAFSLHSMTFEQAARQLVLRLHGSEERWEQMLTAMRHAFKLSAARVVRATKHSFRTPSALSNQSSVWIPEHETGISEVASMLLTGKVPPDDKWVPRNRFHLLAMDFMLSGKNLYPLLVDVQRVPSTAFRAQNQDVVELFEDTFRETFDIALEVMRAGEDHAALEELRARRSYHWLVNEARRPAFRYDGT